MPYDRLRSSHIASWLLPSNGVRGSPNAYWQNSTSELTTPNAAAKAVNWVKLVQPALKAKPAPMSQPLAALIDMINSITDKGASRFLKSFDAFGGTAADAATASGGLSTPVPNVPRSIMTDPGFPRARRALIDIADAQQLFIGTYQIHPRFPTELLPGGEFDYPGNKADLLAGQAGDADAWRRGVARGARRASSLCHSAAP